MVNRRSFRYSRQTDSPKPGTTRRDLLKIGGLIAAASGAAPLLRFDAQCGRQKIAPVKRL